MTRRPIATVRVLQLPHIEHESLCGECDTEDVHAQGDQTVRELTDRAWEDLLTNAARRYVHGRRN
jgi:hypothetical protein